MAHKKAGGSSRNGRDFPGQRLGVKMFGGEHCRAGNIIVRQHGTKWHPGENVGLGRDYTIFALIDGRVAYRAKANSHTYVSVVPNQAAAEKTVDHFWSAGASVAPVDPMGSEAGGDSEPAPPSWFSQTEEPDRRCWTEPRTKRSRRPALPPSRRRGWYCARRVLRIQNQSQCWSTTAALPRTRRAFRIRMCSTTPRNGSTPAAVRTAIM